MLANATEGTAASLWFTGCVAGGLVLIAIGARAAGLAVLGALVGSFIGGSVTSDFDQIPQGAMLGASVGAFTAGLAGLAWRSSASPAALCVVASATIVVGIFAGWAAYSQMCDGYWEKRCLPEVDAGSLALFALDAAWVAALCCVQAALANRARRSSAPAGPVDVADAPSR